MPSQIEVNHYILHFTALSIEPSTNAAVRRRASVVLIALNSAPVDLNPMIDFLDTGLGVPTPDVGVIRGLIAQMRGLRREHPTDLASLLEGDSIG